MIKKFLDFFNKKNNNVESVIKKDPVIKKEFNIDEFNDWFKNEYTGYGGSARGIFLRTDKLSHNMIEDYLKEIGINKPSYEDIIKYYEIVRKDWVNKLNN